MAQGKLENEFSGADENGMRQYTRQLDQKAEQMQVAIFEAFPQDAFKVLCVPLDPQHFLVDAHIEAAHIHLCCDRCASSGLRNAAAGQRSALLGLKPPAQESPLRRISHA